MTPHLADCKSNEIFECYHTSRSAVMKGYIEDPFAQYFVKGAMRMKPRSPIINRGREMIWMKLFTIYQAHVLGLRQSDTLPTSS